MPFPLPAVSRVHRVIVPQQRNVIRIVPETKPAPYRPPSFLARLHGTPPSGADIRRRTVTTRLVAPAGTKPYLSPRQS